MKKFYVYNPETFEYITTRVIPDDYSLSPLVKYTEVPIPFQVRTGALLGIFNEETQLWETHPIPEVHEDEEISDD